ncbi:zinc finger CCCH domain-containing protein 6-like [Zingiber officinale]|uniref:zinc finger CCCH domain-containing protein 6-like n=1 Tax=Zingiber officinale TaxID=94328 RepID=UPI001C4DD4A9|nr:zinc finger CCCH domain-containing protein 6-like [Zingiber officinale]
MVTPTEEAAAAPPPPCWLAVAGFFTRGRIREPKDLPSDRFYEIRTLDLDERGSQLWPPPPTAPEAAYPERPGRPNCDFYMRTGACLYDSSCRYHHPRDRLAGKKECSFYMRTGQCKFGRTCKFNHPEDYVSSRILQSSVLPQTNLQSSFAPMQNLGPNSFMASNLNAPPTQHNNIALREHSQFGSGMPFATYIVPQLNLGVSDHDDYKEFYPRVASSIDQSSDDQIEHMLPDTLDLEYPAFEKESFRRD